MADRAIYSGDDINSGFLKYRVLKHTSSAFTGGGNEHGDKDGTPTYTIFTVNGVISVLGFLGVVNTALVGNLADLEVGVTGNLAILCGLHADVATTLNENTVFTIADEDKLGNSLSSSFRDTMIVINGGGTDIIETTLNVDITGGQIDYYIIWAPLSPGATVVDSGALS